MAETKTEKSTILKYMTDGIRYVCEHYKNRAPGTESERKAQEFFRDELKKYADEVEMEDFDLHPHAFMGFIILAGLFSLISVFMYWLAPKGIVFPIIGIVMTFVSILMFVFEFLMYRSFVDFLFPKRVSRNVMARRKPSGEVKRRIIFGGHADAAYEWTFSLHGQLAALVPVIGGAIISMFTLFGFNLAAAIHSAGGSFEMAGAWKVLGIIALCLIPFCILILFFINWRVIVDGANDNLSACYIAIAVLKQMADQDFRFENTEVCCLISGSEEAGLRGAKAYAKRHKEDLQDVETVYVAMDTMREVEQLQVYTKGCTWTVWDSEAVGDLIHEAGVNVGIDMPRAEIYPGAIDAEGFSMYGLTAAGFCGVNHDPKTYYHTRKDTPDNIGEDCIELSLKVCEETARLYDANGGLAKYEAKYKK